MKRTTPEVQAPAETRSVAVNVLQELRTIHQSLEAVIDLVYEAHQEEAVQVVAAIEPAVDRLGAIIRENDFPE